MHPRPGEMSSRNPPGSRYTLPLTKLSPSRRAFTASIAAAAVSACGPDPRERGADVVMKYQPFWGPAEPFEALVAGFERGHGVTVRAEAIPNDSDVAHQYFLTALEGGDDAFDVLVADVVWVPEFARAGWIADLSAAIPPEAVRRHFVPGAAQVAVIDGRTVAVPWFVDVGIIYRRTDLVQQAPRTWTELAAAARRSGGFAWQGRQYEGLTCVACEAIHGHGGSVWEGGAVLVDSPAAAAALAEMRGWITTGISPRSVLSMGEEEARRLFQAGRVGIMRNWPYAWSLIQAEDSPVAGRVAVSPMPTLSGAPGYGTLGGWFLAVNANVSSDRRALAARLVEHLSSEAANETLAIHYSRNPARRATYASPRVAAQSPFIVELADAVEHARPRPVTPYYGLLADTLQAELSAAVSGLRPPEEALARAQRQIDRITGAAR